MKFIKLSVDNNPIIINVEHINKIIQDAGGSMIYIKDSDTEYVDQSVYDIGKLLANLGLIN